jgi:hypothetical protein
MRDSLASYAREWACANLTWEQAINKYEALYKSLIENPVRSRAAIHLNG